LDFIVNLSIYSTPPVPTRTEARNKIVSKCSLEVTGKSREAQPPENSPNDRRELIFEGISYRDSTELKPGL
jgi:hypothetical protein